LNGIEVSYRMSSARKAYYLHQLRKNQWLKPSELQEIQNKKLRAIIKHAYDNTEFYHKKFRNANVYPGDIKCFEDLEKIPITTKAELQENALNSLIPAYVDLSKCRIIPTSGSTGTPLKVVYDEYADDFSKAVNLRSHVENGLKIYHRWVNIGDMRTAQPKKWFQKIGLFSLNQINIFDPLDEQINLLQKYNPHVIDGYPSQLRLLSRKIQMDKIDNINPEVIFSTAELLDDDSRNIIKKGFNCDVIDLFGCIEVNRTAWECKEHQGYHMDIDSVAIELVDSDNYQVSPGEKGEIIYTSLYNYSMPLIRYKVGDIGVSDGGLCSCGRSLPLMKKIEGRSDDYIILPSRKKISPIVLALVMKHTEGVLEYQFIQEKLNKIFLSLVVSNDFDEKCIEILRKNIQNSLYNEVDIVIKIQSTIKKGPTGKIRSVISKIELK